MKITQLSVFLENKPGRLGAFAKALADAGVSIITLSMADTESFGILRLIVADWRKAKSALEAVGMVSRADEVLAIEVPDKPGGLAGVLAAVDAESLNVEYMYAFTTKRGEQAVLIFRFSEPDRAVEALGARGVNVVGGAALLEG